MPSLRNSSAALCDNRNGVKSTNGCGPWNPHGELQPGKGLYLAVEGIESAGNLGRWPAVLLIGSKKPGLFQQLMDSYDFTVRIPMAGQVGSIHAAATAGSFFYEFFHQTTTL